MLVGDSRCPNRASDAESGDDLAVLAIAEAVAAPDATLPQAVRDLAQPFIGRIAGHVPGLTTAERSIEHAVPRVSCRDPPFRSEIRDHPKGRIQALEDLMVELPAR